MKYYVFIFYLIYLHTIGYAQNENKFKNSRIEFKSEAFQNKMYYLAGYYGKYTVLLDSANASNVGSIIFKKGKKYTEGLYLLVDKEKKIVLEFMMDTIQQFSIEVDSVDLNKSSVKNSKTNQDFFDFNFFLKNKFEELDNLNTNFSNLKTNADSLLLKNKMIAVQKEINSYKFKFIKEHPKNVISLLFKLSQPIETYFEDIENPSTLYNSNDSLKYVKNNFFKEIDFSDPRLLRNPFLEKKIETYFNSLVVNSAEEITKEVFKILDKTGSKENETFSYLSLYFMNTYSNPKIMGLDRVFINVYNKYFKNQEYSWLTISQKLSLNDTNRDLKDNLIGNLSPNLFMKTIQDKRIDLYEVKAPFTVLIFWDPSCGHCIKEIPKIKKMYDDLWKTKGIKVFAVNINVDLNIDWRKYIEKENLNEWINVYPSSEVVGNYTKEDVDFQTLFNVHQTPVLYLLDANKKFIAKKVGYEKYLDIIKNYEIKLK